MVMINRATKEITLKIVYYGPGLCGKTTNLEYIYSKANPGKRGKLLSVTTETDRTLFFDFLPVELGTIRGMKVRVQLYTVPGQVFYDATRRIVLRGSDGVVFVADSQSVMVDANMESLQNLKTNLRLNGLDPDSVPLVFQYNKQDLRDLSPCEDMEEKLNWRNVPSFLSVATVGQGVNETLRKIIEEVIRSLHEKDLAMRKAVGDKRVPASGGFSPTAPTAAAEVSGEKTSSFSEVVGDTDDRGSYAEASGSGPEIASPEEFPGSDEALSAESPAGVEPAEEPPGAEIVEDAPLPEEPEEMEEAPFAELSESEASGGHPDESDQGGAPAGASGELKESEVLDLDALDDEPAPMEDSGEAGGNEVLEPVRQGSEETTAEEGPSGDMPVGPADDGKSSDELLDNIREELNLMRLSAEDFTRRLETLAREASALRSRIVFMQDGLKKKEDE